VIAAETNGQWIQKLDPSGKFLLALGKNVNLVGGPSNFDCLHVVAYEIGCEQTHGVERAGCFLTAVRARRIRLDVYAAAASCSGLQGDRRTSGAGADS
jgi:hypothetical protein